ncbi:MAG TPA: CBS domain-containing protein [Candidatus Binataceae bacterium]|nr:CBS domain-containing protein [Candidatus Binataceae bacterium]
MATRVSTILRQKGHDIVTVRPNQTVLSVAKMLTINRIGAAPVIDDQGRLVGIISERDIVRALAENGATVLTLPTELLMTREVTTCSPEDVLVDLMGVMTNQRIRHLPVVVDQRLHGIVSIGDVVKQRLDEVQFEVEELRRYIWS